MKLEHSFEVALPPHEAFDLLLDVRRIAGCMPGATLESVEGDDFSGTVRVKLGPVSITYAGRASIRERDSEALRAVVEARGKESRGAGEARAMVEATLHPTTTGTRVEVVTDLAVTGKPAQLGRGLMSDVGRRLIGQFAAALAADIDATLNAGPSSAPHSGPASATADQGQTRVPSPTTDRPAMAQAPTTDEIDLLSLLGDRLPREVVMSVAALMVGLLVGRWSRRGSRRCSATPVSRGA